MPEHPGVAKPIAPLNERKQMELRPQYIDEAMYEPKKNGGNPVQDTLRSSLLNPPRANPSEP